MEINNSTEHQGDEVGSDTEDDSNLHATPEDAAIKKSRIFFAYLLSYLAIIWSAHPYNTPPLSQLKIERSLKVSELSCY